jgi:branched-chain amino acid transport system ATP-binding protein
MSAVLELDDVAIRFGGVQAVGGVTCSVEAGDLVGLIGPNGAGKTTLIRMIAGLLKPDRGNIALGGVDITTSSTAMRVRRGLALTHQIVRPLREMTVLDNVVLGAGLAHTSSPLRALLHVSRRGESERAMEILESVGLAGVERKPAGALPLGQLKRLELARALAVDPKIVLLDEPLAGLNHTEAARQAETILEVHRRGVSVVLVEHNLEEVMRICRRLIVLNNGVVIGDGEPRTVMADPTVHDAYVGSGMTSHADA